MSSLERNGFQVKIQGPQGAVALPGHYQPGAIMADPYGGQGGYYFFEITLYEDGPRLIAVATCVSFEYSETREARMFVSEDGGRTLKEAQVVAPKGKLIETLVIES